jgi:hypothetical protein
LHSTGVQLLPASAKRTLNKVFIVEVFFPQYPELRIRQKFLTAP